MGFCRTSELARSSRLYLYTVNSRLADIPLLRTPPLLRAVCKSPAETTMKCFEITLAILRTLAITDSRYYGIVDTTCGPQHTFLLFCSRYNRHLGRISLLAESK